MKTSDSKVTFHGTEIDYSSGEVLEEEVVHKRGAEPSFVKLYLDCLCNFKGLSKTLNPILFEFLKYMTYANISDINGGQIIYLNGALKKRIADTTGKGIKRIEQAITDFVKVGIFTRIATGTYQVNAELFGKGDWKDIKNIRATFDFGERSIETEIIKHENEVDDRDC